MQRLFKRTGIPLLIALAGGSVAELAGIPAGMLLGGAVLVALYSLSGRDVWIPLRLRNIFFVLVGMALGSNVSNDTLSLIPQWPWTLVGLLVALVLAVATATLLLHFVLKIDTGTAYLASFPGHLTFVLVVAESGYGNSSQIAIIQGTRLLFLTVIAPVVAIFATQGQLTPVGNGREEMELVTFGLLAIACTAGGFVFNHFKMPVGFVLGAMVVATAAKLAGLYDGSIPREMTLTAYVGIGALIGSRFAGVTFRDLGRNAVGGLITTGSNVFFVTIVAFVLAPHVGMPVGQIWLGLAPGGIETMGAVGIALGFDTAFIAAHHAVRMFLLPLFISTVKIIAPRSKSEKPQKDA